MGLDIKIAKQTLDILKYKEKIIYSEGILLEKFILELEFIKKVADKIRNNKDYNINEYKIKKKNGKYRNIVAPCKDFIRDNRRILNFLLNCSPIIKYAGNYKVGIHTLYPEINNFSKKINDFPYILKIDIKDAFESTDSSKVIKLFETAFNIQLYNNKELMDLHNFLIEIIFDLTETVCYKGKIPQGFPTSKLIFDCIMNKVDWGINKNSQGLIKYFRYVDDIAIFIRKEYNPNTIVHSCLKIINKTGYLVNHKKMQIVNRIMDKKFIMFLGACIHHPNDVSKQSLEKNDTERKIKIKKKTRNKFRSYKYLADKYKNIDSIAVRESMKNICN